MALIATVVAALVLGAVIAVLRLMAARGLRPYHLPFGRRDPR